MRLKKGILNILAISKSLELVSFIPVNVFMYIVGITTIAGINMASSFESNHNRAKITKEATGTVLNILIGSHKNISIR